MKIKNKVGMKHMLDKKNTATSKTDGTKSSYVSREDDRKRKTDSRRTEQLETYGSAIAAPKKPNQPDRRRRRRTPSDVDVPQKQKNMNALRLSLIHISEPTRPY